MKIEVYPRSLLEQMWQEDKSLFTSDVENPPLCLRCGKPLNKRLIMNALSRHADVHICRTCGTDEALRDACDQVLPLQDWYALSSGRKIEVSQDNPALTAVCNFDHIFKGPKKLFPLSSTEHPASELAYSRSDFDGRKWWTTWFRSSEERVASKLSAEIDQFTDALFQLPELRNLGTMRNFCISSAQPTSDKAAFNLYADTEYFHIWLRLITRFRDYNLYVHYYLK